MQRVCFSASFFFNYKPFSTILDFFFFINVFAVRLKSKLELKIVVTFLGFIKSLFCLGLKLQMSWYCSDLNAL